jgi:hypothetical protein
VEHGRTEGQMNGWETSRQQNQFPERGGRWMLRECEAQPLAGSRDLLGMHIGGVGGAGTGLGGSSRQSQWWPGLSVLQRRPQAERQPQERAGPGVQGVQAGTWPGRWSWSSACQAGMGQSRYLLGAREHAAKRPSQPRL